MANKRPKNCIRISILGFPIDVCKDVLFEAIKLHADGGGQIVTLNVEMIMEAKENNELSDAIRNANLVIPDGAGVVWALSRQTRNVFKSPGIELAKALLIHAECHGWQVALVGSTPHVMNQLKNNLLQEMPKLKISMAIHGYQNNDSWQRLEKALKKSSPDLVLVALGTPNQEIWSWKARSGTSGIWMGVGGSFDVWSGAKKRAPNWMLKLHVEWLYRLIKEPKRWRRMLSLPAFVLEVFRSSPNHQER